MQERGDFARAGLDVRIVAPADPNDPPRLIAARRGDIGIFYQKNLHLAVDQGLPLVRVGTLVATPLATLTVLRDGFTTDGQGPAGLFFGTRGGEVYGSVDDGDSWSLLAEHLPPVMSVRAAPLPT